MRILKAQPCTHLGCGETASWSVSWGDEKGQRGVYCTEHLNSTVTGLTENPYILEAAMGYNGIHIEKLWLPPTFGYYVTISGRTYGVATRNDAVNLIVKFTGCSEDEADSAIAYGYSTHFDKSTPEATGSMAVLHIKVYEVVL